MMPRISRILSALALLGALARPAAAADPTTVVIAVSDPAMSVGSASYTSLQETLGLVKRNAGVDVRVQAVAGATAAAQAISAGNAFYNWGGMASLIVAAQKDPSLAIISFEPGNSFRIVVPAASPIRTVQELKGRMIGTQSFGAAAYLFGRAVVSQAGLDPQTDVHWLPIGVGAQAAAALRGGMAAAYAGYDSPDAIIGILLHDEMRELPSPLNDLPGMSGIIVRREAIEKYPKIVGGICRSFYEALVFAGANPQATVLNHWRVFPDQKPSNTSTEQALAEGVAILRKRLAIIDHPGADGLYGYQTLETMQHTADALFKAGLVEERPDMSKLIDGRFKDACGKFDANAIVAEAKAWKVPD